jgi:hypothetical protein
MYFSKSAKIQVVLNHKPRGRLESASAVCLPKTIAESDGDGSEKFPRRQKKQNFIADENGAARNGPLPSTAAGRTTRVSCGSLQSAYVW